MKNLILILSLLTFTTAVVIACSKEQVNKNAANSNANQMFAPVSERDNSGSAEINITCKGTCKNGEHPDPSESTCAAMLYDGQSGTIECPCSDCSMQFTSKQKLITPVIKYFNEHLIAKTGSYIATVYSIDINEYPIARTITFIYKIPGQEEKASVMYIINNGTNGSEQGGPIVEVDCTGGCDSAGETCREQYDLASGKASCTCEGSCKLTVTYKE